MAPVLVQLSGVANISRRPERGVVSINVSSKGKEQPKVAKEVQDAAVAIQTQIRPLAEVNSSTGTDDSPAVMRWSSDAMINNFHTNTYWVDKYDNVVPNPNYGQGPVKAKESLGIKEKTEKTHFASIKIVVRFRDLTKLSEFTTNVSLNPLCQVDSVSWVLTEDTKKELRGQAIKEAYKDAHEKATAFAEAIGVQNVKPISIKPQGSETPFLGATVGYRNDMNVQAHMMGQQMQMQMQQPQQQMLGQRQARRTDWFGQDEDEDEVTLTFVPQDVGFHSAWDLEFELS